MSDLSNWADIGQHLFDRYCIEGVDEDFCRLAEQHDIEVYNKAIDDFMEKINDDICCDCSKCGNGCILLELRAIAKQLKGDK